MSTCAFPLQPATGTYRTNALGYGVPSLPAPPQPLPAAPVDTGDYSRPYAYEAGQLPNMIAFPTDGLGDDMPVATMRIVRASGQYAIGTALSTITGAATGFLLNVKTMCVTPLRETACDGNVYAMTKPRALLHRGDGVVTVVGNAYFMGEDLPAIAHVYVASGVVKVLVGCGKPEKHCDHEEDVDDEVCASEKVYKCVKYYDVLPNPCDPCLLYIAGARNGRATVFVVNAKTGIVVDSTSLYVQPSEPVSETECVTESEAVTMTLVAGAMLVVGVHVNESSSMLWALSTDTLQELSMTAGTSYNHRLTQRLRVPMHCADVTVVRVFGLADGTVYAVAIGHFDTVDNNMPSRGVLVYKFTPDTMPDMTFGVSGIALWFDPRSASTRLNDATLADDGSLYIVGNAFETEPVAQTTPGYRNMSFPFLNVDVLRSNLTYPSPFLLQVRCDGAICPLLNGLRGCAVGLFANTVIVHPATATILGDVWFRLGCPSQPAGVLNVELVLRPCPRIINANRVALPVIDIGCTGPIVIDKRCGETTLQVAGPVVVGCVCETTLPLAGAIAFDPYTGAFMGYDGYSWKAFVAASPPPM